MHRSDPQPLHCRHDAFEALMANLEALDTTRGLLRCVVAVSMHELGKVDGKAVETRIESLVGEVADRLHDPRPQAVLAHAHAVLFDEHRFRGNTRDYNDPHNSYPSHVLESRQGLPITLTLIYKCVLEALGVSVKGINMPGHFLAGVRQTPPSRSTLMLIDPFDGGRMLTREDAFARIEQIAGGAVARDDALLRPATHAQWLIRTLQNLAGHFAQQDRLDDHAAAREMITLVESVI